MKISGSQKKQFNSFLSIWYKTNGRADLPWRVNQTPYRVFISEIMLQQTQVTRVVDKFNAWMILFPNIKAAVQASQTDILSAWQGLGYNRRGLYTHKACKEILNRFSGAIPIKKEELESLPGIGPYTAGAICAFAFNQPTVFIETNIRRVVIYHFFKNKQNINDKEILVVVKQLLPKNDAKNWYAAIMDYGATLPKIIKTNPNKQSKTYTKQSKFKGSNRQIRGEVLRQLLKKSPQDLLSLLTVAKELKGQAELDIDTLKEILEKMQKEDLVQAKDSKIYIVK
jgi:A/G-specific adenine glycosylase